MNSNESALTPKILGYLGLVPFLTSGVLVWFTQFHTYAVKSLSIYAAVILTFIGGVHWGIAMHTLQNKNQSKTNARNQFIFSVIPSLIAWMTIVFTNSSGLVIIALCFGMFWLIGKLYFQEYLSSWYIQLRTHLTWIACFSIIIGWFGTLYR